MNIIEWRDQLLESTANYKAKFIGLVLSQYYRPKHPTYPSIRTLSQMSGLTVNPVQSGIKTLIEFSFLERSKRRLSGDRYLSNIYTFIGVTETRTVSPHDTSNDTSNDTSPHDTKVEEIEEEEKVKKNIKKKHTKPKEKLPLPDWLPKQDWNDYLDMRRLKNKYPTDRAKQMVIIKLDELRSQSHCPSKALQQSIINNWTSVFATKESKQKVVRDDLIDFRDTDEYKELANGT